MADNAFETLAEFLDAGLPDGVQVYGWSADSVKAPAVVLTPGSPLQVPVSMGPKGASVVAWAVECQLLVSRSQPKDALRALYTLRKQITTLLPTAPDSTRWIEFGDVDTISVGDQELLQGTLALIIQAEEEL